MPSVTLRNATDTWVWDNKPSKNYADGGRLHVQSGNRFAYVFFNRAAPIGATVLSAKLRLYHADSWGGASRTITARRISEAWKLSRTTWNNRPGITGTAVTVTDTGGADGKLIELDVTAQMQTVSDGARWYGFRIETDDATDRKLYSAQGRSTYRPTLEVSWTEAPDAPSTLNPSGNDAVSIAKPTLTFDFTDELGDTALSAVQVQIDPTGNFAAPAFDSGWIDTTEPELDLSTTAYAGLAAAASTFWRVRVRDGAGLDSEWSDDEQFQRVDKSLVTITNPAAAPNNFVSEPTPPITWTFSGVQKAFRVLIVDPLDPSRVIADSGKRTSTETSWTVPNKKLIDAGPYRVDVQLWDNVDRTSTPNDPTYSVATREFDVRADLAVVPVEALTATQDGPLPRVVLTWTRATAPDKYVVKRDNRVIEDELLPEDALVSGTSYEFRDDESKPWVEHTWQVQAVVNNAASGSSVVTFTPKQRGIWLLDKGRDRAVWLAGQEGGSWALGEEATVFAPIGAKRVVRRIQGQRGYEGSLSGQLVDQHDRTWQSYEADLLAMRDEPDRAVTLALGDMSLRVILGNIATYPTPHVPPSRVASFEFWEVQ